MTCIVALAILRWTVFAARPLTVLEMTEALAVREDDSDNLQSEEIPDVVDDEYINDEILDLCGSLVEIRDAGPDKTPQRQNRWTSTSLGQRISPFQDIYEQLAIWTLL